jgi:hypothetical protein
MNGVGEQGWIEDGGRVGDWRQTWKLVSLIWRVVKVIRVS